MNSGHAFLLYVLLTFSTMSYAESESFQITTNDLEWYLSTGYFPEETGLSSLKAYAPMPIFLSSTTFTDSEFITKFAWKIDGNISEEEKNKWFYGPHFAYLLEHSGVYTVTLYASTGASNTFVEMDSISIEALSTKRIFHVNSQLGNDNFSGLVANGEFLPINCAADGDSNDCTDGPWKTADKAFSMMIRPAQWAPMSDWNLQPGDRVLFKRGQTFEFTESISIDHGWGEQGYSFGAFGDENLAEPVINWGGLSNKHFISFAYGNGYIGFFDLVFNFRNEAGIDSAGLLWIPIGATKNIVLARCEFLEPQNAIVSIEHGQDKRVQGLFLFDNLITNYLTHDISVTQMYTNGVRNLALINNNFDKSGNHTLYTVQVDNAIIHNNVFARPAFGRTALRIAGGDFSLPSSNIDISNNKFLGWIDPVSEAGTAHNGGGNRYNFLLVNFGPNNSDEHSTEGLIFKDNQITNCEICLTITNVSDGLFENNSIYSSNVYASNKILFGGSTQTRPNSNIKFVKNKFFSNSPLSIFKSLPWEGGTTVFGEKHNKINISNNLIILGSNATSSTFYELSDSHIDEFTINNNAYGIDQGPIDSYWCEFFQINCDTTNGGDIDKTKMLFIILTASIAEQVDIDTWQTTFNKDSNSKFEYLDDQFSDILIIHEPGEPSSLNDAINEALIIQEKLNMVYSQMFSRQFSPAIISLLLL